MKIESHLKQFSPDKLLSELLARGVEAGWKLMLDFTPKHVPALRRFSSEEIHRALVFQQLTIYGVDDRKDVFQVPNATVQADADGVVALFDEEDVIPNGNGTSRIFAAQYGPTNNLCPCEPFFTQPQSRCATGFLVNREMILTAGHIHDLESKLFVFGFKMANANAPQVFNIPNSQIHRAKEIIAQRDDGPTGDDFALVRLEKAVTDHRALPIRRTGQIPNGQAVQVLGHPRGLPLKFADGAHVTGNGKTSFFVANLDTYTNNSGSPVFNSNDVVGGRHVVEGILVRGGQRDFVPVGGCLKSLVCEIAGGGSDCPGEECTRVTRIAHLIP